MNTVELPFLEDIRRNHGLEHGTIHVLNESNPNLRVAGRATYNGFFLYGDLKTEDIAAAAEQALQRIQGGERRLAVHPGCGTNLVTTGVLAGVLGFFASMAMGNQRRWYDRLPNMTMAGVLGVVLSKPFGPWLQANVTTSTDVQGMRIRHVVRRRMGRLVTHFVETARG